MVNNGYKKRGRKRFSTDLEPLINSNRPVSFNPSRITREEMAYCMRESGNYNKSAVMSQAIKYYHDHLIQESIRRANTP